MTPPLHGIVVSDFHVGNLVTLLSADPSSPGVEVRGAPFGQVASVLMGADDAAGPVDFALVWTRPEAVVSTYGAALRFEGIDVSQADAEVDAFVAQLRTFSRRVGTLLVATWAREPGERGLGMLDLGHPEGPGRLLRRMNARLVEALGGVPGIYLLDAERWVAAEGLAAPDPRLWYMAKIPWGTGVFREAVRDTKAALRGVRGEGRRLVVVDLDDTLWGGIVGETGPDGLRLGGHDPVGEAFVDFQRELKALARRGVILGIVSRNDEAVALRAIREHPEMVLRPEDFAGWRINWGDKAANLAELLLELNLGPASVVFLDDSPAERGRVREALPEVLVPEWPGDPLRHALELRRMDAFDQAQLSGEDRKRAESYRVERARRSLLADAPSLEAWLGSLELEVEFTPLDVASMGRAAQLLNKTNQMNLRTRRLSEAELAAWTAVPTHRCWTFRVRDRFSDAGLTGLATIRVEGKRATMEDFVLSCRVFGRKVENVMLHVAARGAHALGAEVLEAHFIPTERNAPCLEFFRERSGLGSDEGDPPVFRSSPGELPPLPDHVELLEGPRQAQ